MPIVPRRSDIICDYCDRKISWRKTADVAGYVDAGIIEIHEDTGRVACSNCKGGGIVKAMEDRRRYLDEGRS